MKAESWRCRRSAGASRVLKNRTAPEIEQAVVDIAIEQPAWGLVTVLSPVIGYDKAAKVAQSALAEDLTLEEAVLKLSVVSADEFDRVVDPRRMVKPYVAER